MTIQVLQTLIDKQDNFEIVRDQIAAILVAEIANQQAKATAAAKDPDDWKIRVYTERSNPFEQWLNLTASTDRSPLININVDQSSFDEKASDSALRQKSTTIYNIDCYGLGVSSQDGTGHKPGDREANLETQRAVRLVRNMLMAGLNRYLQMQGTVWGRWPNAITFFQPEINDRPIQHVSGARFALSVSFNEVSPEYQAVDLELVSVQIKRAEDGLVLLDADYEST